MPAPLYRYFDSDVRSDPRLVEEATEFALGYTGDFEFLIHAQELAQGGPLPVAVARGVLNCMRSDPRACSHLPVPQSHRPTLELVIPVGTPREVRRPRTPPPLTTIRVQIRVKNPYGISSFRGYKLHRVADASCRVSIHRNLHGRPSGIDAFPWAHFSARWVCQSWSSTTNWPHLLPEEPPDSDRCAKCFEEA